MLGEKRRVTLNKPSASPLPPPKGGGGSSQSRTRSPARQTGTVLSSGQASLAAAAWCLGPWPGPRWPQPRGSAWGGWQAGGQWGAACDPAPCVLALEEGRPGPSSQVWSWDLSGLLSQFSQWSCCENAMRQGSVKGTSPSVHLLVDAE